MSQRPNINRPEFDEPREHEGFRARRARLGHQVGSELLGASLWEIDPGQAASPYHVHLAEEELLVVLAGRPSLRTPEGCRQVDEGEVLWFPRGEAGAHQLVNRTDSVVRFLAFSTQLGPDVVLQADSGKVGAFERRPRGGGLRMWFHADDARGYYDGEAAPDSRSE